MENLNRTASDNDTMLAASYASLFHWEIAGNALHLQRGHWLVSRVHTHLGNSEMALYHAERCMQITENNPDKMEDFDIAFAHESVARAHSISGHTDLAGKGIQLALNAAKSIAKKDDRDYFLKDLKGNVWGEIKPDQV